MKRYVVKTRFVFDGEFYIAALNKAEAKDRVEKDCGLVMEGGIHSTLPNEDVDWNFDMHPEKKIVGILCERKGDVHEN
jgi:hypothetical protein